MCSFSIVASNGTIIDMFGVLSLCLDYSPSTSESKFHFCVFPVFDLSPSHHFYCLDFRFVLEITGEMKLQQTFSGFRSRHWITLSSESG